MRIRITHEFEVPVMDENGEWDQDKSESWKGREVDALEYDDGYIFVYNKAEGMIRHIIKEWAEPVVESPANKLTIDKPPVDNRQTLNFKEVFGQQVRKIEFLCNPEVSEH